MHRLDTILVPVALLAACGGSAAPPPRAAEPSEPEVVAEPGPPALVHDGQIVRDDLVTVLDAGLGRFLQGVQTEPALADGRFVGFRLTTLFPNDERVAALDLKPGDVVLRVNGQPIERPEQALRVWNGLRVASELLIEYQRDGEARELRFEIVDPPEG